METVYFSQFGTLHAEEWRRLSVVEITKAASKGGADKDRTGTPYDERMGVLENGAECLSCRYDNQTCMGHFGHIELPEPIYNRQYFKIIYHILQCVCPFCSKPRIKPEHIDFQGLLRFKNFTRLKEIKKKCASVETCPWEDCLDDEGGPNPLPSFSYEKNTEEIIMYYGKKKDAEKIIFTATNTLGVFLRISNEHLQVLGFNSDLVDIPKDAKISLVEPKTHPHMFRPESLIIQVLPVLPPAARPYVIQKGEPCDDDITDKLNAIIKKVNDVKKEIDLLRKGKKKDSNYQQTMNKLREHIWTMMDNKHERSKLSSGGRPHKCLTLRVSGKDGRLQHNILGKRVDFSARSVITGAGTELRVDQLGVPKYIAEKLTKPEIVGDYNIDHIQDLVRNQKVNRILRRGRFIRIRRLAQPWQFIIKKGDIAWRQLRNGDVVLFNRQPTLRIESMQSFRVKIVDGYAFRLPLALTGPYNADFDKRQEF